jgi:hypothetical protein
MKSLIRIATLAVFLSMPKVIFAQDELDKFLEAGASDAEKLLQAYASPIVNGLTLSLNQGWYNTAKPHKIAGVDLTITVNSMAIPTDENFYNPSKLKLTAVELAPSSADYPNAPTLAGPDNDPTFQMKGQPSSAFNLPGGMDLKENLKGNRLPIPIAHLGFGLPKNTDIKIRFTPEIELGDVGTVKLFGIGVMHDIKQWIPGVKLLPFDLSAFIGYTKVRVNVDLDGLTFDGDNQRAVFEMSATTIQALISKKISVVTFYGGVGYNIAKSNLAVLGTYDLNDDNDVSDAAEKNPLDLNFAASGARMTGGMRLKLAVFTFHADYTLQKYNCFSAGFGISVR